MRGQYRVGLDMQCSARDKPNNTAPCNLGKCLAQWYTSDWSEVSFEMKLFFFPFSLSSHLSLFNRDWLCCRHKKSEKKEKYLKLDWAIICFELISVRLPVAREPSAGKSNVSTPTRSHHKTVEMMTGPCCGKPATSEPVTKVRFLKISNFPFLI